MGGYEKMFCKNCGQPLNENQAICLNCGVKTSDGVNFCSNCGNSLAEGTAFCPSCGAACGGIQPRNVVPQQVVYVREKIPGRGFGITSLVLGIVGLVYAVSLLLVMPLTYAFSYISTSLDAAYGMYEIAAFDFLPVLAILIYSIPSILAVIFGIVSEKRGYHTGIRKGGFITGCIGLILYVLSCILAIISVL